MLINLEKSSLLYKGPHQKPQDPVVSTQPKCQDFSGFKWTRD